MAARKGLTAALIGLALLPCVAGAAMAETPAQLCGRLGTDDTLRPLPASLVPAVRASFGLRGMSADWVRRSTRFRCANRKVLVCNTGANLPCGKANTSRSLPSAAAWCRRNPDSDVVPMAATGHDTIYEWRCIGRKAQAVGTTEKVDARGFVQRYWKTLD